MKTRFKMFLVLMIIFSSLVQVVPITNGQFEEHIGKAVYFIDLEIEGINGNNQKYRTDNDAIGGIDLKYGVEPLFFIEDVEDYGQVWITPNVTRYAQLIKLRTSYYIETNEDPSEFFGNILGWKTYHLTILKEGDTLSGAETGLWTDVNSITFNGKNSVAEVEDLVTKEDTGKINFRLIINKNLILPAFMEKEYNTSDGTLKPFDINIFPLMLVAGDSNFSYVENRSFTFTQTSSTAPTIEEPKLASRIAIGGTIVWGGRYRPDLSFPVISQYGAVAELPSIGEDIDIYVDEERTTKTSEVFNDDYFSVTDTVQYSYFDIQYRIKPEYKFIGYHHVTEWSYALFYGALPLGITAGMDSVNTINRIYVNNVAKKQNLYLYIIVTSEYHFEPKAVIENETMLPPKLQLPSADVTEDIIDVTVSGTEVAYASRFTLFDFIYQFLWVIIAIIIIIAVIAVLIILFKKGIFGFGFRKKKYRPYMPPPVYRPTRPAYAGYSTQYAPQYGTYYVPYKPKKSRFNKNTLTIVILSVAVAVLTTILIFTYV